MKLNELIEKLQKLQNDGCGDHNVKIDSDKWGQPVHIYDMRVDSDSLYIIVDNNGL